MARVKDNVALITGAAQGLGAETARLLAAEGASVVLTDVNVDGALKIAEEINAQSPDKAVAFEQDVSSESGWQQTIEATRDRFGGLNILVNNAGIGSIGSVEDESLDTWHRVHAVDLDSVFLGCKYGIPLMAKSGGGSIVNVSSISGIIAGHNLAAYNSAKAAVRQVVGKINAESVCRRIGPSAHIGHK